MPLAPADAALVSTIYSPPRARQAWTLDAVLPAGATTYYSLARWALVDALHACGVGTGDRVLVPGLICRDVLASVEAVGATAVFYPVSPRLCPVSLDAGAGARAVLAVNYFGFPQDLRPFRELCARTGAALIEDNAHGLFSRDDDGCWLGGRGDAGVFSFRKTIALPAGGALVVTGDKGQATQTAGPVDRIALRYRLKQGVRRLATHADPVVTLAAISVVRRLRASLTGDEAPSAGPDAETRIPVAANPPTMVTRRIAVADPQLESDRRRALYQLAHRVLEEVGAVPVFPQLPSHAVPFGFPLRVSPDRTAAVSAQLARHGLPLLRWPDLPSAVAPSAADHYRHLMVVPFLW